MLRLFKLPMKAQYMLSKPQNILHIYHIFFMRMYKNYKFKGLNMFLSLYGLDFSPCNFILVPTIFVCIEIDRIFDFSPSNIISTKMNIMHILYRLIPIWTYFIKINKNKKKSDIFIYKD
jgi:hypothetical protein